jgi:methylglutamate dehydrogenase subunit A
MDMSMDGSPIIDTTPLDGHLSQHRLVLRRFQGDAGLRAVLRLDLIARDEPHPLNAAYRLDRFRHGVLIDEKGAGATPNLH